MRSFAARSTQPELMDSEPVAYAEFAECLHDLARINQLTLAYRPTLAFLDAMAKQHQDKPLTILDAGSGGGDMLRVVAHWAQRRGRQVSLIGVDLHPYARQAAETMGTTPSIRYVSADIFSFEPSTNIDIILSSLFTHHLNDAQLQDFIAWMERRARIGWCINDLHRHWLPYYFIRYAAPLLSRNRLIRHDAPVSVARAFRRSDWETLQPAGTKLRWWFPFRWTVTRSRP
jgi:2-polyprenyl-3-methyl-5-hydroxy-6-metoxy-1,4-benzoquinol methylase